VSEEAKDLIKSLLNINPKERLSVSQTLHHPWMQGADINKLPDGEIFN
jgi:serine/threonine protein kinase